MADAQYTRDVIGRLVAAIHRDPRWSPDERVVSLVDLCSAVQLLQGMGETMQKAIYRAEIGLGLAGMVIAERDDLSAAFELGRQAGLDEAALGHNDQLQLGSGSRRSLL